MLYKRFFFILENNTLNFLFGFGIDQRNHVKRKCSFLCFSWSVTFLQSFSYKCDNTINMFPCWNHRSKTIYRIKNLSHKFLLENLRRYHPSFNHLHLQLLLACHPIPMYFRPRTLIYFSFFIYMLWIRERRGALRITIQAFFSYPR